ncbi:MAG: 2-oxo acid dehydrogenase subunit E2 [Thermoleophilaceae bacterium]|nr:2-oxo acid dehydrogenase subunit E2 [Thermoleophilaceae bacterium]
MPRLSDSMEEGTVLKWLVEEGGEVRRGEPLVEIETDKANMTYEADSDGVLLEVLAKEGDTLPIGELIARVGRPGETPAGAAAEGGSSGEDPPSAGDAGGPRRPKASPVARRMAMELGVELSRVQGTGPGGRILKADVEAAAERGAEGAPETPAAESAADAPSGTETASPAAERPAAETPPPRPERGQAPEAGAKGEVTERELTRLQRTVSRRMAESKATVPDFALELDVDMTLCIELRERLKEQTESAPSFNDMVVKAAASALREHPRVNGAYRDGRFELYSRVNVGIAVAAQDALVVPVIPDADQKSMGEISRRVRRLVERVREGEITPPELSGGTFTVSNLGMYGVERFTAIVNAPQAAILTVGALMKKPWVDDRGRVVARDLMTLTLVCDHRILYGADGAEFLARVRALLEQPLSLAL